MRATLTSKGRVTIPYEVRQRLGLKQGDRVDFIEEDGVTILRPVGMEENPFTRYVGALGAFESRDEANAWLRDLRSEEEGEGSA